MIEEEKLKSLTDKLIAGSVESLMEQCTSDECDALEAFVRSVAQSMLHRRLERPWSRGDLEWAAQMWRDGK